MGLPEEEARDYRRKGRVGIVILSEAKEAYRGLGSFASLRMTISGTPEALSPRPYDRTPYPSRRIAAIPAAGPSASTGKANRHPTTSTSAGII